MNSIQIGKRISNCRKEKGITQEELANYLGVSKPAVSKWESGQSFPDILMLPELAAYFNISVDQLIGYEPQMAKEDVRKLYHRLAEDFAKAPFDKVYTECEEYIRKYYSCWYLQHQMALLLVNHSNLAGSPELIKQILERALEIFVRVGKYCEDVPLAKQALHLQALCHLALQHPVEAIDILEDLNEHIMPTESLLVKAYQMKGDQEKALEYLQGYTFVNLTTMLDAAADFFQMYAGQPERLEQYYNLFIQLSDLFEAEKLNPAIPIKIHLAAAIHLTMLGKNSAAMDALEKYVAIVNRNEQSTFRLHGNRYFDVLEKYVSTIDVETTAPRSTRLIWSDIKNLLLQNPAFASLEQEERFKLLKKKLES